MRTEFAPNTISDREHREEWEASGAKDSQARAHEVALRILKEHQPLRINPDTDRRIRQRFPYLRDES
jgi:trimethylamine:corrinoid methyltransferase-like protein